MYNFFYFVLIERFVIEFVLFPFEIWEQCTFFSENIAVKLYPVKVVARAF